MKTTREKIIERIKEYTGENKCALYMEVEDLKAKKAYAYGTGDVTAQLTAISQYLITLSETIRSKSGDSNATPVALAKSILDTVQKSTEPTITGKITSVKVNN